MSIQKPISESFKQQKIPFTSLPNYVLQNFTHIEALSVWCHLVSLPTVWNVNREYLMKKFDVGRDKINKILKVLIDNFLLSYEYHRDAKGQILKVEITIKDGTEYNEKIVSNLNKESTTLKTRRVVTGQSSCGLERENEKLSTKDVSTTLKTQSLDNPVTGETAPIKETLLIKEKEKHKGFSTFQKQERPLADVTKQSTSYGYRCETPEEAARKADELLKYYRTG